jgi:hypothetical protein
MIPYILHAGLILAGCLAFYKLLLQRETFFQLNRWVLLACLVLSFTLPSIQVPEQWSFRKAATPVTTPAVESHIWEHASPAPPISYQQSSPVKPGANKQTTLLSQVMTWIIWLYWFGVIAFGINFLVQVFTLLYRAYTRPVIRDGRFRIVELAGDKAPCSFGNNIYINPEKYDWDTYNQILMHEKVHIRQGHSIDLLLAELVLIFQWFNPFAWLYRKTLENNLEFLTDDRLVHQQEVEKSTYQLSLLKVSAPHFPLSVTMNYNQSLLKRRVAMMNAKKSNVHTTWKYFFLLPVLVLFVCLFNEPAAVAQAVTEKKDTNKGNKANRQHGIETEGFWFATIKEEKIHITFKTDTDDGSTNTSTFPLSEVNNLPRDKEGSFALTRDAGAIQFTGKFEGAQGMGRYQFTANKAYAAAMQQEGIDIDNDKDQLTFFLVDVKRAYVQMLKENGFTQLNKQDVIPLAALKVDAAYIQSLKKSGFTSLTVQNLIPLKALGVSGDYISEIRKAGYPNVTPQQIITFKAQGIDGKYIADLRQANAINKPGSDGQAGNPKDEDEVFEDIVAIKALNIDASYINSLKEVGYDHLSNRQLVSMKSLGITADYIKTFQNAGFKHISPDDLAAVKAQHVTPEYLKSFRDVGYPDISIHDAIAVKSLNVTPEYITGFKDIGYKNISLQDAIALKAQHITPALVQEYKALSLADFSLHDVLAAKATGVTPGFITSMKDKGHNLRSLNKYIQLKTIVD